MIARPVSHTLASSEPTTAVKRSTAFWTSIALSAAFLAIYGGCNWLTAHRSGVPSIFFQWERQIPFVPLMILPYMSIDLFFVSAPFLCRSKRELDVLARRLAFALVVGAICFLLFPLRFAFERPPASGLFGAVFEGFRHLDQPYNLVPSLHIAMLMCLAPVYLRRARPLMRGILNLWFALIALSTVLTYQHHVVDVIGGFVLGIVCLYAFPGSEMAPPVLVNRRIGIRYGIGSAFACVVAEAFWPWAGLLLWPATSMAIVAGAYLRSGPVIFRKNSGRLPWSSRIVLGPCLVGQYFSLKYYARRCRAWDEVAPGVLIGRRLNGGEAREAISSGVTAVLDLTAEFSEAPPFINLAYLNVPILDLTAPTQGQLKQMGEFISQHAASGKVYVHCKIGYSRSASAVGAYLLATGKARGVSDVLARIRSARPSVIIRPEIVDALKLFSADAPAPRKITPQDSTGNPLLKAPTVEAL
jgi:membrane-associated phospholipid phosphatase